MKKLKDSLKKIMKQAAIWAVKGILMAVVCGYAIRIIYTEFSSILEQNYKALWKPELFFQKDTYIAGALAAAIIFLLIQLFYPDNSKTAKKMMANKAKAVEGALENSRFMLDKERDQNFPHYDFTKDLPKSKKDGIPVFAEYNKKNLNVNLASPMHGLIIGATGSGKTTTFINPMIQILGRSAAGSSMIVTDPKGELFQLHSRMLAEKGYDCMVLDLREPYNSFKWNPLGSIWDLYQQYIVADRDIFERKDEVGDSGLTLTEPKEAYGEVWYEYQGKAYAGLDMLRNDAKICKQKLYDEAYEDLNDLIGVLCPIESENDPVWEKGAKSIILATLLAMLEDSENPELGMTKDKFNFFNLSKAISNSENEFEALKHYFEGRNKLSKSVTLSRQVMSAAENTLSSYMSIAFDKMNMFNDEGICALTSSTDIDPKCFAEKPTALFLKIPDEKDTRHGLAAVFILCIYKALIKLASAREDLSLPRNVYFILDEFGNMPKIDKFDKMITVGRSRKIWFNMVVQSYAQLNNVYGDKVADIIKSNCGMKMFIGSNDIATCEEFSKLCGNMTVSTNSVSSQTGERNGQMSVSTQVQTRPLIYPNELMKLNNKESTGNAIIVTFGNHPLKTRFTPSYRCPLYQMGQMDISSLSKKAFFPEDIYYDLEDRNKKCLIYEEVTGDAL